ncbi:MAG TPA: DUF4432 family protein, partial [Clostridia bacterium]|nr:DUF4432 family protein [Clostridia bacterium]
PLMLLYHINFGYPILDQGSKFVIKSKEIIPNDAFAKENIDKYNLMSEPVLGQKEQLYFHTPASDSKGNTYAAIVNEGLELGAYVKFNIRQLPYLSEWKQMSCQDYVLGIEPGNCIPIGRSEARKRGILQLISPGEQREFDLEIGVLDGAGELGRFVKMLDGLK